MRIAALYDVHGNLPALRAVLGELPQEEADLVVVGGDVAAGPMPAEVLDALTALAVPVRWVMGNADREVLEPGDGDDPTARVDRWAASRLSASHRELVASFEATVSVDDVLFCHGSPRSDTEMITRITPPERLAPMLEGVEERLVVCGHTHQQFDFGRVVNAGSVGMPYEGEAGAFWALVVDGRADLRRTQYDIPSALEELRASGMPDVDELILRETLYDFADPDGVARFFEP